MRIRGNDLLLQEIDGEAVILDSQNGKIHKLNPVAHQIWKSLAVGEDINCIVDAICNSFGDCEPVQVEQDVRVCMQQLVELDLLRI